MRRAVLALTLLLFAIRVSSAGAEDRALLAVNHPAPGDAAELLDAGVMVVRDMERYLIAAVTPEELAAMSGLGAGLYQILDPSMEGKTYYTVTMRSEAQLPLLKTLGRVLRADRFDAVVEATFEEANRIVWSGFEIAKVFVRPIRIAPAVEREATGKAAVADPQIQGMINEVQGSLVDSYVLRLQNFGTRYCTTDSGFAAGAWIRSKFESFGIDSVHYQSFSGQYHPNVIATIPGVGDPSKVVVIGGHYDSSSPYPNSNAPGADDDASGTSCVIEAARVLSGYEFNHTLTFVAFAAEEIGLYGSEAYASDAAARGDDIIAAVCADMIGYVEPGDLVDIDIVDNTGSEWIRDAAFGVVADYLPGFSIVDGAIPGGSSSDHASFWGNGYNAILFFEDTGAYSPYIHTTSDVVGVSYNNSLLAEMSVKTAVGLLATLAEPFRVAIIHDPLGETEDTQNDYRVVAEILSAEPLEPDSLLVRYSTGAGWNEIPLAATGNPNEYEAFIPAQSGGTWVDYFITAGDVQGNGATHPKNAPAETHRFFVGIVTTSWSDDFETDKGWTGGVAGDDATTGAWERCDPQPTEAQPADDHTPAPGVNAWITQCAAGSGQGSYDIDGGKTTLLSPILDLTGLDNASVRYWLWYVNDTGSTPGTDYWYARVSDDGGSTWVTLDSTYSSHRPWTEVEHDLGQYISLTDQVRFRFVASDLGSGSIVEAGIDDFSIVVYQSIATGVAGAAPGAAEKIVLHRNVPNPFNPVTEIRFDLPAAGRRVSLKVYDVAGREVKSLVRDELLSGSGSVRWDGTDNGGRSAVSGIYFYRLEAGEESFSKKMILLR